MEPRVVPVADREQFTIAVVDDDDIYRDFVTAVVSASGRFVTCDASNGTELCEIIATRAIDCIVLDYNIGDESREIAQGDLVHIPPDKVHSLRPVSDHAPIHCFCFAIGVKGSEPIDYTSH